MDLKIVKRLKKKKLILAVIAPSLGYRDTFLSQNLKSNFYLWFFDNFLIHIWAFYSFIKKNVYFILKQQKRNIIPKCTTKCISGREWCKKICSFFSRCHFVWVEAIYCRFAPSPEPHFFQDKVRISCYLTRFFRSLSFTDCCCCLVLFLGFWPFFLPQIADDLIRFST